VRSELEPAAIVESLVAEAPGYPVYEDPLVRDGDGRLVECETGDAIEHLLAAAFRTEVRVVHVDVVGGVEVRVHGEAEQAALAYRRDREVGDRLREEHAVVYEAEPSRTLREQDVPVWQEIHRPGDFQVMRENLDRVVRRIGRMELDASGRAEDRGRNQHDEKETFAPARSISPDHGG